MSHERWIAVDDYYSKLLMPPDAMLDAALQKSNEAELPAISVAANQGKMLMLLAQMQKAKTRKCRAFANSTKLLPAKSVFAPLPFKQ